MKKIALALAAIAFSASAFAADVSFYNKLYEEDPFYFHNDYADENSKDFPVLKDEMSVEYQSEHVDASITAVAGLDDFDDKHFGIDGYIDDWYVEYRLLQPLTLGLHDNIYMDGSALPVYDDNLSGGDIGSDGFTVVYRPSFLNDALRIAATLPFNFTKDDFNEDDTNWLKTKDDDDDTKYVNLGLGAIYDHEFFQIGVTVQDILDSDERVFGSYISFPNLFGAVEGLTIGGGFTHTSREDIKIDEKNYTDYTIAGLEGAGFDDLTWFGGVTGENLVSANLTFEKGGVPVSLAADFLYNLGQKYIYGSYDETEGWSDGSVYVWDLYAAATLTFGITEQLSAYVGGKLLVDTNNDSNIQEDKAENVYGVNLGVDFQLDDHNSLGAGFEYQIWDSDYQIAIPVYWQWTL